MICDETIALEHAIHAATMSPCAKSKRGVAIFARGTDPVIVTGGVVSTGCNHQPGEYRCSGTLACRINCNKLCVHAEEAALLRWRPATNERGLSIELVHVKVEDGKAVPTPTPTCVQCSRLILEKGISTVWLLGPVGLTPFSADLFHRLSLDHHKLPVHRAG